MKSKPSFAQLPAFLAISLLMFAAPLAQSAATDLATTPISGASAASVAPNVMFTLDESLSMRDETLPDWAGGVINPTNQALSIRIGYYAQKVNSGFNGLAYNPGVAYSPPTYYKEDGTPDTTTYPSQTKTNTDGWTKVGMNPFLNTSKIDLLNSEKVYSTLIPGEYCTNAGMRVCAAQSAPTTAYPVPATLRWCNSAANALAATASANNVCQATEIDDVGNTKNFANPRMPWPRTSTYTITNLTGGTGSITSITIGVGGPNILSAPATGTGIDTAAGIKALAKDVQDKINACAFTTTGTCAVAGYRAIAIAGTGIQWQIVIYAPSTNPEKPVFTVSSVSTNGSSPTAFTSMNTNGSTAGAASNVPGLNLPVVISETTARYPKAGNRTDCVADASMCTYDEEMTNYANWYAYYRTRMQLMKTAASQAFASVDEKYRVGFMSINNQTGTDEMGDLFLNVGNFDATQKKAWYDRLFSATPVGDTPLRLALAQAGRLFAGQLKGSFGTHTITDPVQYACQKNVNILSTDGYWNEVPAALNRGAGFKLDGTTDVGHQDSNTGGITGVIRPQLDGGTAPTFTKAPYFMYQRTTPSKRPQVKIKSTSQKSYVLQKKTKDAQQYQSATLQQRDWQLKKLEYIVQSKGRRLYSIFTPLEESVYKSYYYTTTDTTKMYQYQLYQGGKTDDVKTTYALTSNVTQTQEMRTPAQKIEAILYKTPYTLTSRTYQLQKNLKQVQTGTTVGATTTWVNTDTCTEYYRDMNAGGIQCRIVDTAGEVRTTDAYVDVNASGSCTVRDFRASGVTSNMLTLGENSDQYRNEYATTEACKYTTPAPLTGQATCLSQISGVPSVNSSGATPGGTLTSCEEVKGDEVSGQTCRQGSQNSGTSSAGVTWKSYSLCRYGAYSDWTGGGGSCTFTAPRPDSIVVGTDYTDTVARQCKYGSQGEWTNNGMAVSNTCTPAAKTDLSIATNTVAGKTISDEILCRYNPSSTPVTPAPTSCKTQPSSTPSANGTLTPVITCAYTSSILQGGGLCTVGSVDTTSPSPLTPAGCVTSGDGQYCAGYSRCVEGIAGSTGSYNTAVNQCLPAGTQPGTNQCSEQSTGQVKAPTANPCVSDTTWDASGKRWVCETKTTTNTTTSNDECSAADLGTGKCKTTWFSSGRVASCTPTKATTTSPEIGDKKCDYVAPLDSDRSNNLSACVPKGKDATNNPSSAATPALSCYYTAWDSNWADDFAACKDLTNAQLSAMAGSPAADTALTAAQISAAGSNPKQCQFYEKSTNPATSCTPNGVKPPSLSTGPFTVNDAVVCQYSQKANWKNVSSCVRKDRPAACIDNDNCPAGNYTQDTATDCQYTPWSSPPTVATCPITPPSDTVNGNKGMCTSSGSNGSTCTGSTAYICTSDAWGGGSETADTGFVDVPENGSCTVVANNTACRYRDVTTYYAPVSACPTGSQTRSSAPNYTVARAYDACQSGVYVANLGNAGWVDVNARIPLPKSANLPAGSVKVVNANGSLGADITTYLNKAPTASGSSATAIYEIEEQNAALPWPAVPLPAAEPGAAIDPASCVATSNDNTYKESKVECVSWTGGPAAGGTACQSSDPSSANNWTGYKCAEVDGSGTGTPNTLADVAQFYYMTDLRTSDLDNCSGAVSGENVCANNQRPSGQDTATWQHMTTYTLGLGASGLMRYQPDYETAGFGDSNDASAYWGDFFSIAKPQKARAADGICSWMNDGATCNWPGPANNTQTNIDDLWHAAVNGRGTYYSASNATSLTAGLSSALSKIDTRDGARAALTFSSRNLRADADNMVFYTSFTAGAWSGELTARSITSLGVIGDDYCTTTPNATPSATNPRPGAVACTNPLPSGVTKVVVPPLWQAQAKLDSLSWESRAIYTFDSAATSKLKLFKWDNLTEEEQAYFKPASGNASGNLSQFCTTGDNCLSAAQQTLAKGQPLVDFLRGDRSYEDTNSEAKLYRQRAHVLGDLVNADPVYVQAPLFSYADKGYWDFKAAQVSRTPMVYAAANDGMLHAFYGKTNAAATPPTVGGQELWAYIPRLVQANLYHLADKDYKNRHQFFVDGTPVVGDICVSNCSRSVNGVTDNTPAVWKTILVGGLNHGGKGYYALDITDPAAPKALWEFSHADLGYSYGNPVITKRADGTWSVLFGSGYNNADGVGRVFVLNANTGEQVVGSPISTGVGTWVVDADGVGAGTPSGLARLAAWADYPNNDNTALRVYGGDLLGNLWRITLPTLSVTPPGLTQPTVQLLAVLKDAQSNAQPITARPELAMVKKSTRTPAPSLILIGTGALLGNSDMSSTQQQSFYGILDSLGTTTSGALYTDLRSLTSNFVKQTMETGICPADATNCTPGLPMFYITETHPVDLNTKNGWLIDFLLPNERATAEEQANPAGERANTNPMLVSGTLLFNTNTPSEGACVAGGSSNTYYLDAMTGGAVVGGTIIGSYLGPLASNINAAMTSDGTIVTGTMTDDSEPTPGDPPISSTSEGSRRVSWRELLSE